MEIEERFREQGFRRKIAFSKGIESTIKAVPVFVVSASLHREGVPWK